MIYAEDLVAGRRFELGRHTVTREEILAFASQWDPLPMHVDERAAQAGPFGGLIASGLHTLGVYQRLAVPVVWQGMAIIAGRTLREIRMMRPVRPDTTLTGHVEWREVQPRAAGDAVLIAYAELCEAPDGPAVFSVLVELVVAGRGSPQPAGDRRRHLRHHHPPPMPSPQLQRLVELLSERAFSPGEGPASRRADFEAAASRARLPDDVTVAAVDVAGRPGEWLAPAGGHDRRAILHLHGGGYVLGSCHTHRALGTWLARAARVPVLTCDYRLAPEHPHPAALEDAVAAYRWLLDERGLDPGGVALSGDSAGGGLTIATLVALRDRGLPLPAAAVAISPWSDLTLPGASIDANAERDPQVRRWLLQEMAAHYLAGADPRSPLASPRYADLRSLPPLLIHVGGAEGLLDDARALADAARSAGVEVTLEAWPEMIHVWHAFAPILPEALDGLDRIAEWLEAQWAPGPPRP